MRELPLLDESRCTGCGDCVFVCPIHCLELTGAMPTLPRPMDCVCCELCARVCPVDAVQLVQLAAD
jgi:NAD-dependent dihydropyrimidine dehydrogenase PreA subunit